MISKPANDKQKIKLIHRQTSIMTISYTWSSKGTHRWGHLRGTVRLTTFNVFVIKDVILKGKKTNHYISLIFHRQMIFTTLRYSQHQVHRQGVVPSVAPVTIIGNWQQPLNTNTPVYDCHNTLYTFYLRKNIDNTLTACEHCWIGELLQCVTAMTLCT